MLFIPKSGMRGVNSCLHRFLGKLHTFVFAVKKVQNVTMNMGELINEVA